MKKRAFINANGGVTICTFPPKEHRDKWRPKDETDEEFIERVWKRKISKNPLAANYVDIENSDLPPRIDADGIPCRDCWHIKDGKLQINDTKKSVHREIYELEQQMDGLTKKLDPSPQDVMLLKGLELQIKEKRKTFQKKMV